MSIRSSSVLFALIMCVATVQGYIKLADGGDRVYKFTMDTGSSTSGTSPATEVYNHDDDLRSVECIDDSSVCIMVGDSGDAFRSNDDGETWTSVDTTTNRQIREIDCHGGLCVAVTEDGRILESTNNGNDWTIAMTVDNDVNVNAVKCIDDGCIYAGDLCRVGYRSGLGANDQWTQIDACGGESIRGIGYSVVGGTARIIFPTNNGVVFADDNGATNFANRWDHSGPTQIGFNQFTDADCMIKPNDGPTTCIITTDDNNNRVIVTEDGGDTWASADSTTFNDDVKTVKCAADGLACAAGDGNGNVYFFGITPGETPVDANWPFTEIKSRSTPDGYVKGITLQSGDYDKYEPEEEGGDSGSDTGGGGNNPLAKALAPLGLSEEESTYAAAGAGGGLLLICCCMAGLAAFCFMGRSSTSKTSKNLIAEYEDDDIDMGPNTVRRPQSIISSTKSAGGYRAKSGSESSNSVTASMLKTRNPHVGHPPRTKDTPKTVLGSGGVAYCEDPVSTGTVLDNSPASVAYSEEAYNGDDRY